MGKGKHPTRKIQQDFKVNQKGNHMTKLVWEKSLSSNDHDIEKVTHGTVMFCQRVSWESENADVLTSLR